jgi:hypothetical protein
VRPSCSRFTRRLDCNTSTTDVRHDSIVHQRHDFIVAEDSAKDCEIVNGTGERGAELNIAKSSMAPAKEEPSLPPM